jgi:hypothetical protein
MWARRSELTVRCSEEKPVRFGLWPDRDPKRGGEGRRREREGEREGALKPVGERKRERQGACGQRQGTEEHTEGKTGLPEPSRVE